MLIFEETLRRPTNFQQIALDDSGNLYVAGTNVIYKLSSGLILRDRYHTGPVKDGWQCPPDSGFNCADATLLDNEAVILEAFPEGRYLLFCGTVKQGLCSVYSMENLQARHAMDPSNIVNLIGNRKSAVAFFGQGNPDFADPDGHTLYVGMSHDNRPVQFSPKSVSSREIKQVSNGRYNMSFTFNAMGQASAIDIDESHKQNYIVRYVYGFEHEGFSYFVTVQREDLITGRYVTKLVRVCQGDPKFYSYTEVEISCRKAELHPTFYNIAEAAYLSPVGEELASKFNFPANEQVLFVAFGKGDDMQDKANSSYGHGICMYTMKDVRKEFLKAQLKCYQGYGSTLPWISRIAPQCQFDVRNNKHPAIFIVAFCKHVLSTFGPCLANSFVCSSFVSKMR